MAKIILRTEPIEFDGLKSNLAESSKLKNIRKYIKALKDENYKLKTGRDPRKVRNILDQQKKYSKDLLGEIEKIRTSDQSIPDSTKRALDNFERRQTEYLRSFGTGNEDILTDIDELSGRITSSVNTLNVSDEDDLQNLDSEQQQELTALENMLRDRPIPSETNASDTDLLRWADFFKDTLSYLNLTLNSIGKDENAPRKASEAIRNMSKAIKQRLKEIVSMPEDFMNNLNSTAAKIANECGNIDALDQLKSEALILQDALQEYSLAPTRMLLNDEMSGSVAIAYKNLEPLLANMKVGMLSARRDLAVSAETFRHIEDEMLNELKVEKEQLDKYIEGIGQLADVDSKLEMLKEYLQQIVESHKKFQEQNAGQAAASEIQKHLQYVKESGIGLSLSRIEKDLEPTSPFSLWFIKESNLRSQLKKLKKTEKNSISKLIKDIGAKYKVQKVYGTQNAKIMRIYNEKIALDDQLEAIIKEVFKKRDRIELAEDLSNLLNKIKKLHSQREFHKEILASINGLDNIIKVLNSKKQLVNKMQVQFNKSYNALIATIKELNEAVAGYE